MVSAYQTGQDRNISVISEHANRLNFMGFMGYPGHSLYLHFIWHQFQSHLFFVYAKRLGIGCEKGEMISDIFGLAFVFGSGWYNHMNKCRCHNVITIILRQISLWTGNKTKHTQSNEWIYWVGRTMEVFFSLDFHYSTKIIESYVTYA